MGNPFRTIAPSKIPSTSADEPDIDLQVKGQLPLGHTPVTSYTSYSVLGASTVADAGKSPGTTNGSLQRTSIDLNSTGPVYNLSRSDPIPPFLSTSMATPVTFDQESILEFLPSLGQPSNWNTPRKPPQTTSYRLPRWGIPLVWNWLPPDTAGETDAMSNQEDDQKGVTSIIRPGLVLDRTTESNALPFVLQGFAIWVRRQALEPLKVKHIARHFVFSNFNDGEQSRWIVILLANAGSLVGSAEPVEGNVKIILSMLQSAVRRRIEVVRSRANPSQLELIRALDTVVETMLLHFFASPYREAMILRQEAAFIFRRLCPEPPNAPINLQSLLQSPLWCLRQYVGIDIIFSVAMDMPTLFRYEVSIPSSQPFDPSPSVFGNQSEGVLQWMHGMSNEMITILAKMKAMREDGVVPNSETIASLERYIGDIEVYSGFSSESFLAVMRYVIQECWRQVAYVYLYMAVCGDPCDTPRVKKAFKYFMRLLSGISPGRLPDEFLTLTFLLISLAAQQPRDRDVIRQRILGLYVRGQTFHTDSCIMPVIESYWARADAEGRQVMWYGVAVSQGQTLGA